MDKKRNFAKWLYWFTFALAVIFVYKMLDNFTDIMNWVGKLFGILMPFVVGLIISYLLYLPCRNIEKGLKKSKAKFIRNKSRGLSVVIVYILALIIIFLAIRFIVPIVKDSIVDLASNLGNYYNIVMDKLRELPEDSVLRNENVIEAVGKIRNINLTEYLNVDNIWNYVKEAIGIATSLFDVFVSFIVSIYILLERKQIVEFFGNLSKAIFKEKTHARISKYFNKSNEIFFKFISSQLLDGIIVGVLVSIAMLILNVKYAVLLGFLIGLFNLIPYFGAIIAVTIAIIITLITGGLSKAIIMAIVVIILQQIDANIINPKIVGTSLEISPLLVIFSVTIGGAYFGVLGMFLAVPVMTVIKLIIIDYINLKNNTENEKLNVK